MRTGELTEIASRPANHAQNLAIECHLEDAAWVCRLPNEQHLIGTGGNADRVGSSDYLLEAITCRRSAIDSPRRRIRRHIDRKHALEIAIAIKDLDATVRAIANINIVLEVDGDRVWHRSSRNLAPAAIRLPGATPDRPAPEARHARPARTPGPRGTAPRSLSSVRGPCALLLPRRHAPLQLFKPVLDHHDLLCALVLIGG